MFAWRALVLFAVLVCCVPPAQLRARGAAAPHDGGESEPMPIIPSGATNVRMVPQLGHVQVVNSVAFSPEGAIVASASWDGTVKLWDVATRSLLRTITIGSPAHSVRFSRDGARLLVGAGRDVRLFDARSGSQLRAMHGHLEPVTQAVFSFDEKRIVSAAGSEWRAKENAIRVWDAETGEQLAKVEGHANKIWAVAMVPGDERVLSASGDGTVKLWELSTGRMIRDFVGQGGCAKDDPGGSVIIDAQTMKERPPDLSNRSVHALAVSPDGTRMLTAGGDCDVRLWEIESGKMLAALQGHKSTVYGLAFSPDGKRAASTAGSETSGHKRMMIWNLESHALEHEVSAFEDPVQSVAFSPDGTMIATGSGTLNASTDNAVKLFDANSGKLDHSFEGRPDEITAVAVTSDARLAVAGTVRGGLQIWDLEQGALTKSISLHQSAIRSVALARDGRRALVGADDGSIQLWDVALGTPIAEIGRHVFRPSKKDADKGKIRLKGAAITSIAISADGRRALSGGWDRMVRLWDLEARRELAALQGHDGVVWAVAFAPDGRHLLSAGGDHVFGHDPTAKVWDAATGSVVRTFAGHKRAITALAVAKDGSVVTGAHDGELVRWNWQTGDELARLGNMAGRVRALAFAGDKLVVASDKRTLAQIDPATGAAAPELDGHADSINALAYAADRGVLVSGGDDASVRVWNQGQSVALVAAGSEWLLYSDDGFFDASQRGGDLVSAVEGSQAFRIDQLAVRNNRPDVLLARAGLGTPELFAHYRARHRRRLKALGIRESSLGAMYEAAPTARIKDIAVRDGNAEIAFDLEARQSQLLRYNVYVNDVPVLAGGGKPITGKSHSGRETIELGAGRNKIEVSALDDRGAESLRAFRIVDRPAVAQPELYFVGFGVSRYRDPAFDLAFAHKDVLDLAAVLSSNKQFAATHVATFVDAQVTAANIRAAKAQLARARVDDVVVVLVAGHGMHARDEEARYYYITHDADPKRLADTAASFQSIEELLLGIAPRQKLLLLDTCESGELDDEIIAPLPASAGSRGLVARGTRGLRLVTSPTAPRRIARQRNRYIYNDLARRSGAVVLSSSRGAELSYESAESKNGVFTQALLEALTAPASDADGDGVIESHDLAQRVAREVTRRTEGRQNPTIDRDNLDAVVSLPVVPAASAIVDRDDPVPPAGPPSLRPPPGCQCRHGHGSSDAGFLGAIALTYLCARRRGRRGTLRASPRGPCCAARW
jgi:WD40 repeat protein